LTNIKESKKRTLFKTISWRVVATLNSWIILSVVMSGGNFTKAIIMNITGFVVFYFFERIWSRINYGRSVDDKDKNEDYE